MTPSILAFISALLVVDAVARERVEKALFAAARNSLLQNLPPKFMVCPDIERVIEYDPQGRWRAIRTSMPGWAKGLNLDFEFCSLESLVSLKTSW
jgi:hypothetical protein